MVGEVFWSLDIWLRASSPFADVLLCQLSASTAALPLSTWIRGSSKTNYKPISETLPGFVWMSNISLLVQIEA